MPVTGRILPGAQNAIGSVSSLYEEGWFKVIYGATIDYATCSIDGTAIKTGLIPLSRISIFGASGASHSAGLVPDPGGSAGTSRYLREDGTWSGVTGASGGTVTSVAVTVPSDLSASGTPVTGAGTIAITRTAQSANTVMSGPVTGAPAAPTFRSLVAVDIPSIDWAKITSGKPTTRSGYGITDAEGTIAAGLTTQYWRGDKSWQTLNKTAVGLSNVDNTADASKPLSTATSNALSLKQDIATNTFTNLAGKPTTVGGYGITDALKIGVVGNNGITTSVVSQQLTLGLGVITPISVGIGNSVLSYPLSVRAASNEVLNVAAHRTLTSGTTIRVVNDAENAYVPLEIQASFLSINSAGGQGGVNIGGTSDPGAGGLEINGIFNFKPANQYAYFTSATDGSVYFPALNSGLAIGRNTEGGRVAEDFFNTDYTWLGGFAFWQVTGAGTKRSLMNLYGSGGVNIGGTSDPGGGKLQLNNSIVGDQAGIDVHVSSITGTTTGGTYSGNYNIIRIDSDTATIRSGAKDGFGNALAVQNYVRAGASGFRQGLQVGLEQFGLAGVNATGKRAQNMVGITSTIFAHDNQGGNSQTHTQGQYFAGNFVTRTDSAATYLDQLVGIEIDMNSAGGQGTRFRSGLIVNYGYDQGDTIASPPQSSYNNYNNMIHLVSGYANASNSGVAVGTPCYNTGADAGIEIGYFNGPHPLKTTAAIIKTTGSSTVRDGIDFSSYNISAAILKVNSTNMEAAGTSWPAAPSAPGTIVKWIKVQDESFNNYFLPLYA